MRASPEEVTERILANARAMEDQCYPVEAVTYYWTASEKLLVQDELVRAAECYERIGRCYEQDGRWTEAAEWYSKAEGMYARSGDKIRARQSAGAAKHCESLTP